MEDYKERLIAERGELSIKLAKLDNFISHDNPIYNELEEEDKLHLKTQKAIMESYMGILMLRISKF